MKSTIAIASAATLMSLTSGQACSDCWAKNYYFKSTGGCSATKPKGYVNTLSTCPASTCSDMNITTGAEEQTISLSAGGYCTFTLRTQGLENVERITDAGFYFTDGLAGFCYPPQLQADGNSTAVTTMFNTFAAATATTLEYELISDASNYANVIDTGLEDTTYFCQVIVPEGSTNATTGRVIFTIAVEDEWIDKTPATEDDEGSSSAGSALSSALTTVTAAALAFVALF